MSGVRDMLHKAGNAALEFVYPPDSSCSACGGQKGVLLGWGMCERCLQSFPMEGIMQEDLAHIDMLYSYGVYDDAFVEWVQGFKYSNKRHLRRGFGRMMRLVAQSLEPWVPDLLVPMPLHPNRQKKRGYNQAMLLAQELTRYTGWPAREALRRVRDTVPQVSLNERQRQTNIIGAFALAPKNNVEGQRILLIDDVCTTGSSLSECAKILKEHGATEIRAQVLAVSARGAETASGDGN